MSGATSSSIFTFLPLALLIRAGQLRRNIRHGDAIVIASHTHHAVWLFIIGNLCVLDNRSSSGVNPNHGPVWLQTARHDLVDRSIRVAGRSVQIDASVAVRVGLKLARR